METQPSENVRRRKMPLKELVKEWMSNVTIHGMNKLARKSPLIVRVGWFFLIISMNVFIVMQLFAIYYQYIYEHTTSTISKIEESPYRTEFPAITLCNNNNILVSRIVEFDLDGTDFLEAATTVAQHTLTGLWSKSYISTDMTFEEAAEYIIRNEVEKTDSYYPKWKTLYDILHNGTRLKEFVLDASPSIRTMLYTCMYNGYRCNYTDFETVIYENGICYQFSHGPLVRRGIEFGLSLEIDIQVYDYMPNKLESGLKIYINDALVENKLDLMESVTIQPGTKTDLNVDSHHSVVPNLSKHKCNESEVNQKMYTTAQCRDDILTHIMLNKCKCSILGYKSDNICGLIDQQDCVNRKVFGDLENIMANKVFQECVVPCSTIQWMPVANSVVYPIIENIKAYLRAKKGIRDLLIPVKCVQPEQVNWADRRDRNICGNKLNPHVYEWVRAFESSTNLSVNFTNMEALDAEQYPSVYFASVEHFMSLVTKNLVTINIYRQTGVATEVVESLKYPSFMSTLPTVGGTLGLYIGASILSVFEVIELIIMVIYKSVCGR